MRRNSFCFCYKLSSFNKNWRFDGYNFGVKRGYFCGKQVIKPKDRIFWLKNQLSQKYINKIVDNVKFESPKNLGHQVDNKMLLKSVKFIKENL